MFIKINKATLNYNVNKFHVTLIFLSQLLVTRYSLLATRYSINYSTWHFTNSQPTSCNN